MTKEERYLFLENWARDLCPITKKKGFDNWIKGFEDRYNPIEIELLKLSFLLPPRKKPDLIAKKENKLTSRLGTNPVNKSSSYIFEGMTMAEVEKTHILKTLDSCNGNKRRTSRILNIAPETLYNKLKKWGVYTPQL